MASFLFAASSSSVLEDRQGPERLITLRLKLSTVAEVVEALRKQGVSVFIPNLHKDQKVDVFCERAPVTAILEGVAEITDQELTGDQANGFILKMDQERKRDFDRFVLAEEHKNRAIAHARMAALSKAAQETLELGSAETSERKDEPEMTPSEWAKWRVQQKPYRLLGLVYPHQSRLWLEGSLLREFAWSVPFTMSVAPTELSRSWEAFYHWNPSDKDRQLEGYRATFYFDPITGWIGAQEMRPTEHKVEKPVYDLLRSPLSKSEQSALSYGKVIAGWDKPVVVPKGAPWAEEYSHARGDENEKSVRRTVSDELEQLFGVTKIPIVADATRFAELPWKDAGGNLGDWLESFRSQQRGYARIRNGVIIYRNRSYWRLGKLEISEKILRAFEREYEGGTAGLDEYASLAAGLESYRWQWTHKALPLVFTDDYLVSFDRSPLKQAFPILYAYGCLSRRQRDYLMTPDKWIDLRSNTDELGNGLPLGSRPGGWGGDDLGCSLAASMAPHYGMPVDAELQLLLHGLSTAVPLATRSANDLGLPPPDGLPQQHFAPFIGFVSPPHVRESKGGRQILDGTIAIWCGAYENRRTVYTFQIPGLSSTH